MCERGALKLWVIQAQVVHESGDGWRASTGVPTFYLHPDIQWIQDAAHACKIAVKIIDPFDLLEVYVSAIAMDMEKGLTIESEYATLGTKKGERMENKTLSAELAKARAGGIKDAIDWARRRMLEVADTKHPLGLRGLIKREITEKQFYDTTIDLNRSIRNMVKSLGGEIVEEAGIWTIRLPGGAVWDFTVPMRKSEAYIKVEYDKSYSGGDYSGVGDFLLIPLSEIESGERGTDEAVSAAVRRRGVDPIHIVHYTVDELYDNNGDPCATR